MTRLSPDNRTARYLVEEKEIHAVTGVVLNTWRYNASHYYFTRTFSGTVTPNYRTKRKAREILPDNPYTMRLTTWPEQATFSSTRKDLDRLYTYYGPMQARWPSSPSSLFSSSQATTTASNKAMKRLGDQAAGIRVNFAQFLGERKQVANMLADTATRILHAARSLKRADLRGFTQALSLSGAQARSAKSMFGRVEKTAAHERISSHWLEFVYGWRPLLSDAFGAAELLAEKIETEQSFQGRLVASSGQCRTWHKIDSSTGKPLYVGTVDAVTRFTANYRLEGPAQALLAQTGLSNPLLLAWELLPYSFVVDWFLPIGSYLEALTAFDGFTLVSGTSSTRVTWNVVVDAAADNYYINSNNHKVYSGTMNVREFQYNRNKLTSWPGYVLNVRSPIGGNPLERFATASALLVNLFRR